MQTHALILYAKVAVMHTEFLSGLSGRVHSLVDAEINPVEEIRRYVTHPFGVFTDLLQMQMLVHPTKPALICGKDEVTYQELDELADRVAAKLQHERVGPGSVVAICSATSIAYVAVFFGILKTGAAVSPLSPSATPEQLLKMLEDSGASHLFTDETGSEALNSVSQKITARRIALQEGVPGELLETWLSAAGTSRLPTAIQPESPFNIIYSSGTTGTPKGIVQPHSMRWSQLHLLDPPGYGPEAVAIISTPLYSNTTLVSLLPALAGGGTVVLMERFDARGFLELSERHRVTVAMLVPVQFRRILDVPDFDQFDLSSYQVKYATSAPFSAELKAEVLARWPGGLIEYFGMTEGGGAFMLVAHERPDKLHTVGQAIEGHDMRVIDEHGNQVPAGMTGEVVGRSAVMMTGYHNQPNKTSEAEWYSPEGLRFIRTGDVGRMDEEGFLTLIGRKKDMIISGGMNIYPSDLEAVLREHPAVAEAAVIGAPSERWGETPVGFVTLQQPGTVLAKEIKDWVNAKLGKMQRLADLRIIPEMPRNPIGKILKRELQRICSQQPVA